jgi:hypothetical protein
MSIVYSMKPNGKLIEEHDIELMFKAKAPFKINCASGPFRIFIVTLKRFEEGFRYSGNVADCEVEGFYNPLEKKGTIIFGQTKKSAVLVQ